MPPAVAALAPVVASGVGSLIAHKQQGAAQKQAEEQKRLEAEQADKVARAQWEAQQNSPAAQAARFKATMQLGRLEGAMGGAGKVPPSMLKYYQSLRTMPTYTGVSSYVPTAEKGGGGWDFLGGVANALGHFDPSSALSKPKSANTLSNYNNIGSSDLGAAGAANPAGTVEDPLAALTNRLKQPSEDRLG